MCPRRPSERKETLKVQTGSSAGAQARPGGHVQEMLMRTGGLRVVLMCSAFLATVVVVLCLSASLAADGGEPKEAKEGGSVTTGGVATGLTKDFIMMLTDGEGAPVKYVYADDLDRISLLRIISPSRVRVTYVQEGDARKLLSVKSEPAVAKGTASGVVVTSTNFYVAVKLKDGSMGGYAISFPPGEIGKRLKTLHKGDAVTIKFHNEGYRYRIDSLRVGSEVPLLAAQAPALPAGIEAMREIEFAKIDDKALCLDVYRPKNAKGPLPLVVWIHGGAWMGGSKENPQWALKLVPHGYVVASINYRLAQEAFFPAQIHDCKAAIRFLRANAGKYSIDPDHVGVWGSSAGGHLAALVGATGGVKKLEGNVGGNLEFSSRVQCSIDYYGPTDFLDFAIKRRQVGARLDEPGSVLVRLIGSAVEEKNPLVAQVNPITYVSKDTPPFFVAHGDKDNAVPLSQSKLLVEAIQKTGGTVTFEVVKGTGHDFAPATQQQNQRLLPMVVAFLDRYLKNRPATRLHNRP